MSAIAVENLYKRYQEVVAVDRVSMTVEPGEIVTLLGPNGSGKTTILRAVGATLRIDGGRIAVVGYDTITHPRQAKRHLGVVHQEDTLDPDLNVLENLLIHARYLEIPRADAKTRAEELLERFSLTDYRSRPIMHLSGGLRRRLSLARAFFQARVIILDEPTTGLDPEARLRLWGDIRDMLADNVAVLLTTHDMEEAERLSDRVLLLEKGTVRATGTPSELIASQTPGRIFELKLPVRRLDEAAEIERTVSGFAKVIRHGGFLLCSTQNESEIRSWAEAHDLALTVRNATLGDVYLSVTGKGLE